jgi:hypothetical protein
VRPEEGSAQCGPKRGLKVAEKGALSLERPQNADGPVGDDALGPDGGGEPLQAPQPQQELTGETVGGGAVAVRPAADHGLNLNPSPGGPIVATGRPPGLLPTLPQEAAGHAAQGGPSLVEAIGGQCRVKAAQPLAEYRSFGHSRDLGAPPFAGGTRERNRP